MFQMALARWPGRWSMSTPAERAQRAAQVAHDRRASVDRVGPHAGRRWWPCVRALWRRPGLGAPGAAAEGAAAPQRPPAPRPSLCSRSMRATMRSAGAPFLSCPGIAKKRDSTRAQRDHRPLLVDTADIQVALARSRSLASGHRAPKELCARRRSRRGRPAPPGQRDRLRVAVRQPSSALGRGGGRRTLHRHRRRAPGGCTSRTSSSCRRRRCTRSSSSSSGRRCSR